MRKRNLIIVLISLTYLTVTGQNNQETILSDNEVLQTIQWIRDNPLKPMDSLFIEKYGDVLKWTVYNNPDFIFNIKCADEFIDKYPESSEYPYADDIILLFSLGQVVYTIENNDNECTAKSCYESTKLVLGYYQKIALMSDKNRNSLLDKYIQLEKQNKLEKYIRKKY